MITLEFIYLLMGLLLAGITAVNARDRTNPKRWRNTAFWGIYAATFLFGSYLPPLASGILVLAMTAVAGFGGLGQGKPDTTTTEERVSHATRLGNRLYIPALLVPGVALLGTLTLKKATFHGAPLVDPKQVTVISLGIATLVALAAALAILRPAALTPVREARRLMDTVGWAAVLPQMLAALGALFALAGVGKVVSAAVTRWLPLNGPLAAVIAYAVGMALFTMLMGNAFAAFPVMAAGIGLPLIVHRFGGDAAVVSAIGMLAGFCGTLMTPMAANFNIVPVALLELPDEKAVIRVQVPTALALLAVNTALIYFLAFRR
ncbi:MAG TPA: DUF979 domain-containing protein [Longimicrobium sp.]|nr:DUF979 domain-containing protein [Longimicrobium sp.]